MRRNLLEIFFDQAKRNFERPYESYTMGVNDQIMKSTDYQKGIVA